MKTLTVARAVMPEGIVVADLNAKSAIAKVGRRPSAERMRDPDAHEVDAEFAWRAGRRLRQARNRLHRAVGRGLRPRTVRRLARTMAARMP